MVVVGKLIVGQQTGPVRNWNLLFCADRDNLAVILLIKGHAVIPAGSGHENDPDLNVLGFEIVNQLPKCSSGFADFFPPIRSHLPASNVSVEGAVKPAWRFGSMMPPPLDLVGNDGIETGQTPRQAHLLKIKEF